VIVVVGPTGSVRYLSPSYERVTGRSIAEGLGRDAFAEVHGDDQAILRELLARSVASPGVTLPGQFRMTVADGTWHRFEMVATSLIDDPNVGGVVITYCDVTERRRLEKALERAALHDPLTDLPNRRLLADRLEHALAGAERTGSAVAVLFIDLDGFKQVNDVHGHDVGDQLLVQIARRFGACIRGTDTLARLGGDEFVVILERVTDPGEPTVTAQRLLATMALPFHFGPVRVEISASIGIALSATGKQRSLLHAADSAMYDAKTAGPGRIVMSQWDTTIRTTQLSPQPAVSHSPGG
jgi:diguanylate cyclase (GGDEF)-like protein/PAS domain S-box-containing protein